MKSLILVPPDGGDKELLTPDNPENELRIERHLSCVDVFEDIPGAAPKWHAHVPWSWAVFNGD